jgi:Arm DNA-binding domain
MFLTQLAIKSAKPREKPYKLRDGNGLYLLVSPNGNKLWRLHYGSKAARRQPRRTRQGSFFEFLFRLR